MSAPLDLDSWIQAETATPSAHGEPRRTDQPWMVLIALSLLLWVVLPWLAPVFMRIGWDSVAKPIYQFYSIQCHQLPQRSFFLFGPQFTLSLSEVQAIWKDTDDPAILRDFIGNDQLGFKVAWSDRMVSAYSSILLGGAFWFLFRGRIRRFPIWGVILLSLPLALDGSSHMVSDLSGIGAGFRFENLWLAELTQHRLPQSFYAGTTIGTFNSSMRLITGTLFGIGAGWYLFSSLALLFSTPGQRHPPEAVTYD